MNASYELSHYSEAILLKNNLITERNTCRITIRLVFLHSLQYKFFCMNLFEKVQFAEFHD